MQGCSYVTMLYLSAFVEHVQQTHTFAYSKEHTCWKLDGSCHITTKGVSIFSFLHGRRRRSVKSMESFAHFPTIGFQKDLYVCMLATSRRHSCL